MSEGVRIYNKIFEEHLLTYSQEYIIDPSVTKTFEEFADAVLFASDPSSGNFSANRFESASFLISCFLLEYFLKALPVNSSFPENLNFIRSFSEQLELKASKQPDQMIKVYLIPLIHRLASKGSFLLYSGLFLQNLRHFSSANLDEIYRQHCLHAASSQKLFEDKDLTYEAFLLGIEFLGIYSPRFEILSALSKTEQAALKVLNSRVYFYLAFYPIHAVLKAHGSTSLHSFAETAMAVCKISESFDENVMYHLEGYLTEMNFLNYQNVNGLQRRQLIFHAFFEKSPFDALFLIDSGLTTLFQCFCLMDFDGNKDKFKLEAIKFACYIAPNPLFKGIYDKILSIFE